MLSDPLGIIFLDCYIFMGVFLSVLYVSAERAGKDNIVRLLVGNLWIFLWPLLLLVLFTTQRMEKHRKR